MKHSSFFVLQFTGILNTTIEYFIFEDGTEETAIPAGGIARHGWSFTITRSCWARLFLHVEGHMPIIASSGGNKPIADGIAGGMRPILRWLKIRRMNQT